jgi:DNA modification methylase
LKESTPDKRELKMQDWVKLYKNPLPSNRIGPLYNAFSYPTKISPEAIALFIACHTQIGETIMDPFAGSGTTGLGAKLCDNPTPEMLKAAKDLGLKPIWGKRKAILNELSVVGAFASEVMCNPPDSKDFQNSALDLLETSEKEMTEIYGIADNEGKPGTIRYIIWSEVLKCPGCRKETTYWDAAVKQRPLSIAEEFICPFCKYKDLTKFIPRAIERKTDSLLAEKRVAKKRIPVKVYGRTGKKTWSRLLSKKEQVQIQQLQMEGKPTKMPLFPIQWGVLYRNGYHQGITHLHHLYTKRNARVFSGLWDKIDNYPVKIRPALRLLLLSYNSSHATLMTRVVVKKNNPDFVVTGCQSGVLYISNLPVEKNIFDGLKRKINTIGQAFSLIKPSQSLVKVYNTSSIRLPLKNASVDYVFTDPPFGDYIPYSEINQINEAWLGKLTDSKEEVIINVSQKKGILEYQNLIRDVFREINRVLKDMGCFSLVFHSSKAEIWQAVTQAIQDSNFKLVTSGILDKTQSSFKQVTSPNATEGDPLMLLRKSQTNGFEKKQPAKSIAKNLIRNIISTAFTSDSNPEERKPERLFSRYINACLQAGHEVSMDAKDFYSVLQNEST